MYTLDGETLFGTDNRDMCTVDTHPMIWDFYDG